MAASTSDRLTHVDGLRAIAVLGVVLSHSAKYTLDFHTSAFFHPMYEGAHGVDLFFVISGFCLSYPTLARLYAVGATRFNISRFFAKRFLRIFPPYWAAYAFAIVTTLAMVRAGFQAPWPTIKMPDSAVTVVRQIFLVQNGNELVGSFWTLALELRWYFAVPLLLWIWARSKLTFAAIGLASFIAFHFVAHEVLDFATLPAFMLGIVAADMTIRRLAVARWAPLFAVAALIATVRYERGHLMYAIQDQLSWQIVAFLVVVAGCNVPWLMRVLSTRPLVLVGAASYSIYLFHDPIMGWYGKYGGDNPVLAAAAGILAGIVAWMAFERPYMESDARRTSFARIDRWLSALGARLRLPVEFALVRETPKDQSLTS